MIVRLENIIGNFPYFYGKIRGEFENGRYYCTQIRQRDAIFQADSIDFENCKPESIVPLSIIVDYNPEKNKIVFQDDD